MKRSLIALTLISAACGRGNDVESAADLNTRAEAFGSWAAVPLDGPPAWPLPPGVWLPLAADSVTRVSVDTASVIPLASHQSRDFRVRLLYQFAEPTVLGNGLSFRVLVSEEETDCDRATARVMAATVYDTTAAEVGRATNQPASGPPSMVGAAGAPLCIWLRSPARRHRATVA